MVVVQSADKLKLGTYLPGTSEGDMPREVSVSGVSRNQGREGGAFVVEESFSIC